MNRLGIAGAVWLVAAGLAIAMTLIFRTDPIQWVVTMAIGVVAAVVGVWLIARPSALVVSASNVVAVVWTVLYAVLTMAIGVVAAVVGVWLIARPSALVVSASNVVAVVWTVLYAVLTVQQFDELAAWTTNVFLIAIGAAAGVAAYRAAARAKLRGTIS